MKDGLLRTHQDSMVFAVDNTGDAELTLNIHIAKQPIVDITKANADKANYFIASYPLTVKADEKRHLELRLVNGQYVLSDRSLNSTALTQSNPK